MIHWLKTERLYFEAIWNGDKTAEHRSTLDRDFGEGDRKLLTLPSNGLALKN
jgi:hypothetical protein